MLICKTLGATFLFTCLAACTSEYFHDIDNTIKPSDIERESTSEWYLPARNLQTHPHPVLDRMLERLAWYKKFHQENRMNPDIPSIYFIPPNEGFSDRVRGLVTCTLIAIREKRVLFVDEIFHLPPELAVSTHHHIDLRPAPHINTTQKPLLMREINVNASLAEHQHIVLSGYMGFLGQSSTLRLVDFVFEGTHLKPENQHELSGTIFRFLYKPANALIHALKTVASLKELANAANFNSPMVTLMARQGGSYVHWHGCEHKMVPWKDGYEKNETSQHYIDVVSQLDCSRSNISISCHRILFSSSQLFNIHQ